MTPYGTNTLLDMRDCSRADWIHMNRRMGGLERRLQPIWFRPFFRIASVRQRLGYDHWSRAWEYPWAMHSADLKREMRILDVGSGGSAFPLLLGLEGYQVFSTDPSLNDGASLLDRRSKLLRALRIAS